MLMLKEYTRTYLKPTIQKNQHSRIRRHKGGK